MDEGNKIYDIYVDNIINEYFPFFWYNQAVKCPEGELKIAIVEQIFVKYNDERENNILIRYTLKLYLLTFHP